MSRGKTPPYTPFLHFFAEVCCIASRFPLAVSDAPVFSVVLVAVTPWRRTRHPSGSRLVEVSPVGQTSAPGTPVPQKTIGTLPCPSVKMTPVMAPRRLHSVGGSRQRRRQLNKRAAGHFKGAEVRTNHFQGWKPLRFPASVLSPNTRSLYPNALVTSKGTSCRMI